LPWAARSLAYGLGLPHAGGAEVHGANVVTVDESATRWQSLKLMQELAQPGGLSHTIGNGTVLSFSAGAGDDSLPLGRLGDQVVWVASPVGVGVDDQVGAGRVV
jgi:hypothetical protein